jgi:dihydrofolate reductase
MQEQTLAYFESIWRGADTVLMGRTNYEGFFSVWPGITRDPATNDRTRALGQRLDSVEKVRDVLAINGASIIQALPSLTPTPARLG